MTNEQRQIITELFGGELSAFVTDAGRNFLRIQLQDDDIRTILLSRLFLSFLRQYNGFTRRQSLHVPQFLLDRP